MAGVRTAEGEASNLGGEVCGNHYLSTWRKKALAQKVVSQCNIFAKSFEADNRENKQVSCELRNFLGSCWTGTA